MSRRALPILVFSLLPLASCRCPQPRPGDDAPDSLVDAGAGRTDLGGEAKPDDGDEWAGASEILDAMDRNVDPCADFYTYACGGWIETNTSKIAARPWARGFSVVKTRTNGELIKILRGTDADPSKDRGRKTLEDFFASCMDMQTIDSEGLAPIQGLLDEIDSIANRGDYFDVIGKVQASGVPVLYLLTVEPDAKNPRRTMAQLYQAGLGMPGRAFYLERSLESFRSAYRDYIERVGELQGLSDAETKRRLDRIFAFEVELAMISAPLSDISNSSKNYNPVTLADLPAHMPWSRMFAMMRIDPPDMINIKTPGFFEKLGPLLSRTPLDVLRLHLRWQVISTNAPLLAKDLFEANFEFYGKQLRGDQRPPDRLLSCVEHSQSGLGDLLAGYYVDAYYDSGAEPVIGQMIEGGLQAAFIDGLTAVEWMSTTTRDYARRKAKAIVRQIGAPKTTTDFSALVLDRVSFFANSIEINEFLFRDLMSRTGAPVDTDRWYAPAYVANAYYDPTQNGIVVPAGIIQRPFFDADSPAVLRYAALGMIIGHELTHGFDSNGARYGIGGKLEDWWDRESTTNFEARTACLAAQYDAYEVLPGLGVDGSSTLNENIADNGGLHLAWDAYVSWKDQQESAPTSPVEGLELDQLFFVAFAQQWCTIDGDESLRLAVTSNPHAPARFRVNGSVSNSAPFGAAFACETGAPMAPEDRCVVW